jgi:hypothetical protein
MSQYEGRGKREEGRGPRKELVSDSEDVEVIAVSYFPMPYSSNIFLERRCPSHGLEKRIINHESVTNTRTMRWSESSFNEYSSIFHLIIRLRWNQRSGVILGG